MNECFTIGEFTVNPLMGTGNYSATSNNMKLVRWPLIGGLLHLVQREGDWAGRSPPRLGGLLYSEEGLAVPNVTAHPSTASVLITVLLCGFNVPIEGLNSKRRTTEVVHIAERTTIVVSMMMSNCVVNLTFAPTFV